MRSFSVDSALNNYNKHIQNVQVIVRKSAHQHVNALLRMCMSDAASHTCTSWLLRDSVLAALPAGHFAKLQMTAITFSPGKKSGWGRLNVVVVQDIRHTHPIRRKRNVRTQPGKLARLHGHHSASKLWHLAVSGGGVFSSGHHLA